MFLKVLAMVVGIVAAVARLAGVVSPELARKVIKLVLDRKVLALVMMLVAAVLGSLFLWAFRIYAEVVTPIPWQAWALLAFGILVTVVALLGLAFPNLMFSLASKFYVVRSSTMRLLALLGAVVGAAVAYLGWMLP